ncbi:MAG: SurA N-terminal domain-containing protein [Betaproteobacteria bacterium]|nr:SurA N-terminal domain-containing protein [Betaproteobacteria bacterium]
MLETIRQATQTWLAKAILVVITVPFALWGIESYIRTDPKLESVAKVGKVEISQNEFNEAVRGQIEQMKRQFGGQVDSSLLDTPEMRKSMLDSLIDQKLFAQVALSSGATVSDAALRDKIASEAPFQRDGQFSPEQYQTYLKSQGMSSVAFESLVRKDLERNQFAGSLLNTHFVAKTSVEAYRAASEQAREVAVINITPEQFSAGVKISTEQAKAEYEKNKANYTIPEQVRAEYVELSADALAPTIAIPAEEVKAFYEANSARFIQKEERRASHILINAAKDAKDEVKKAAKAKADELFAQLKTDPKSFAELAKKHSQDTGSAVSGGDLGFFGRGQMVKPFEDAAFGAKKDELVGPVLSDFGYHIIVVKDIRPEKGKSLAEATPEIEGELKKTKASRKFAEISEKFANAAYEQSGSLKGAAEAAGLTIKQSPWMSKMGGIPPFNNPKLSSALFSDEVMKNKRNTEAVDVGQNTLVVARLLESKPAVVRPFEEVEKSIVAKLTREEAGKLAKKDGEAKLALAKEGKGDVKWPAVLAVSRANPGGLASYILDAALKADTAKLPIVVGVENPSGGYSLVQVTKVVEPSAADEAKLATLKNRLAQSMSQAEVQSLVSQARTETKVVVAKDATAKKDQ